MRAKDIVIGKSYRFKEHPNYSHARALAVLAPKQGENTNSFIVVKCEHTVNENDTVGFVRYFKPSALMV
jgi:hypothetical protein